jgi:hypothetical protein
LHPIFILLVALASPLAEESTIQGTVRAAGALEPIAGAVVSIPGLRRTVPADQKGYFVLSGVPSGPWRIVASAPGYATNAVTIQSNGTGVVQLDFELEVRPIVLRPVEVSTEPERAGPMASAPGEVGPPAARVTGSTLKLVPGLVEPDVLRALQVLPSVAAMSDYSSALYVRGGSGDQNLITLDGVPLFNPYHVGGIFSAIGSDAVSSVDLWAGAFPARGGDRLSSLVQIHTRDGGRDEIRTSGAVGLISAHATVDGPLPGGDGAFLFTGRHTYVDVATGIADRVGLIPITVPYGFSDAYVKATHSIGTHGSLAISGYLDGEALQPKGRVAQDMNGEMNFDWGSRMLALSYRQPIAGSLLLEARAGYSGFQGTFDASSYEGAVVECDINGCREISPATDTVPEVGAHSHIRDILTGADLTWFRETHKTRAGVQLDSYLFDHALDVLRDAVRTTGEQRTSSRPDIFPLFDRMDRAHTFAAYIEDEWTATQRLKLRAGLRMLDAGARGRAWLPRLGLRWQAARSIVLSAGAGRYAQALHSLRNDESVASSFVAYDLIAAQPAEVGLARGEDIVVGAEWSAPSTLLRIDAYARRTTGLIQSTEAKDPINAPVVITEPYRIASGLTRGVELMASHRRGNAEFGLSYALTFSERTVDGETFVPRFERRHLLDAGATLPFSGSGVLSARLALGTGQPYTPVVGAIDNSFFDPTTGRWTREGLTALLGEHNGARLPGYLRLDVAARKSYPKRWFGQEGSLTPYVQILNVLNTKNALIADVERLPSSLRQVYYPQLPFLPTFGLEWRF